MARNVTIQSIIDKARLYADMRHTDFVNATEALTLVNDAYCDLYDELVSSTENYFVSRSPAIQISSGTDTYDLPDDFYKLLGVDFEVNSGNFITLKPFQEAERNVTLTTTSSLPSGNIYLNYVPAPTTFTATTDTFDGVAGWERMVAMAIAIDMLDAEESDSRALTLKYDRLKQRVITNSAPRDQGMPARITDVYNDKSWAYIYGSLRYRLYGDQIRLINTEWLGAGLDTGISPFF